MVKKTSIYFHLGGLFVSVTLIVVYLSLIKGGKYEGELFEVFIAIIFLTIGSITNFCIENKDNLVLSFRCYFTGIKKKDIYVSLSYLFRIKIKGENKYLMVRGNKIKHQYQPVGGVYKRFSSSQLMFIRWGARDAKNDKKNSDDLRFYIKGKFIPDVIKWFALRQNREIDVWREFYEELVSTSILSAKNFDFIKPEYLYSKHERLITRKGIKNIQYLIFDIYSIEFTPDQEKEIDELLKKSVLTKQYAFVDEEELDKELFTINGDEYPLGFHARYIKSQS